MNHEIDVTTKDDIYNGIKDFLTQEGYTVTDGTDMFYVVRDKYLIIISKSSLQTSERESIRLNYRDTKNDSEYVFITMCAAEEYDESKPWYAQKYPLVNGAISEDSYSTFALHVVKGKLVMNHTPSQGNALMFSIIEDCQSRYTTSVFIGDLQEVYSGYEGGTFIGGNILFHIEGGVIKSTPDEDTLFYPRLATGDMPTRRYYREYGHRVYIYCHIRIDYSPEIPRKETVWGDNFGYTKLRIETSITLPEKHKSLPTYYNLAPQKPWHPGMNYTQLNGITLCMPIIFYVVRDPQILDTYSEVGITYAVTYVDMYDISSGKMLEATYPVKGTIYQCFNVGGRRNMRKREGVFLGGNATSYYTDEESNTRTFTGYQGIAFRQGETP